MSRELKPCPFCGGEPEMHWRLGGYRARYSVFYWIECTSCGARSGMSSIDEKDCQGEREWNNSALRRVMVLWNNRAETKAEV